MSENRQQWVNDWVETNQSDEEQSRRQYAFLETLRNGSPEQQAEFCFTLGDDHMLAYYAAMRRWLMDETQRKETV